MCGVFCKQKTTWRAKSPIEFLSQKIDSIDVVLQTIRAEVKPANEEDTKNLFQSSWEYLNSSTSLACQK